MRFCSLDNWQHYQESWVISTVDKAKYSERQPIAPITAGHPALKWQTEIGTKSDAGKSLRAR